MKCWHCNTELIWGGDHDGDEDDEYDIISNLSCPNCDTLVFVYHTFNMWDHYCPVEETEMSVGKDEECNWCGATEDSDWNARPECSFGEEDDDSSS
jgi:hypothetical protein